MFHPAERFLKQIPLGPNYQVAFAESIKTSGNQREL
jgi:hypothetical protein